MKILKPKPTQILTRLAQFVPVVTTALDLASNKFTFESPLSQTLSEKVKIVTTNDRTKADRMS